MHLRMWQHALFHPEELERLGLPTAMDSRPYPITDVTPEQILMRLLSFLLLLMEAQVWDSAWHTVAFPNRFVPILHVSTFQEACVCIMALASASGMCQ